MGIKAKYFKSAPWKTPGVWHSRKGLIKNQELMFKRGKLIHQSPVAVPSKASALWSLQELKCKALYKCLQITGLLSALRVFRQCSWIWGVQDKEINSSREKTVCQTDRPGKLPTLNVVWLKSSQFYDFYYCYYIIHLYTHFYGIISMY